VTDSGSSHAASLRARLSSLGRRLQQAPDDAARVAPECLRELEAAAGRLEAAHEQARARDAELRQQRAVVASVEQRLAGLLAMVDAGYLQTDLTGVIQEANPAAARILNLSKKCLAGRPFVLFLAAGRVELMARLGALADAGTPTELDLKLRPRERQIVTVRARICPILDASARPTGLQWLLIPEGLATVALDDEEIRTAVPPPPS